MQIELHSLIPAATFSKGGNILLTIILILSVVAAISGIINLYRKYQEKDYTTEHLEMISDVAISKHYYRVGQVKDLLKKQNVRLMKLRLLDAIQQDLQSLTLRTVLTILKA